MKKDKGICLTDIKFNQFRVLKRGYELAVKKGQSEFAFEGEMVLTSYAKHLVEFLHDKFKKEKIFTTKL